MAQKVNIETDENVQTELKADLGMKWPLPFVASCVAFEPSVDRYKRAIPECADSCAVTLSVNISTATLIVKAIEWMRGMLCEIESEMSPLMCSERRLQVDLLVDW